MPGFTLIDQPAVIPILLDPNGICGHTRHPIEHQLFIVMWLESGECSYCLFVDELLGEQQVVVKQLPSYLNSFNIKEYGINGCTLLGDGSISIILDVLNLYKAAQGLL